MTSRHRKDGPIHLLVDSTGPKIFGEGEGLQNKHKTRATRRSLLSVIACNHLPVSGRKLHLGSDLASSDIVCSDLSTDDVGHPTALRDLLDQIDADFARFIADGAYGGDPASDLPVARFGANVEIMIPPPKTAVPGPDAARDPTLRDQRIVAISTGGRMAWQESRAAISAAAERPTLLSCAECNSGTMMEPLPGTSFMAGSGGQ